MVVGMWASGLEYALKPWRLRGGYAQATLRLRRMSELSSGRAKANQIHPLSLRHASVQFKPLAQDKGSMQRLRGRLSTAPFASGYAATMPVPLSFWLLH